MQPIWLMIKYTWYILFFKISGNSEAQSVIYFSSRIIKAKIVIFFYFYPEHSPGIELKNYIA